jgi:phospholipase D1/2
LTVPALRKIIANLDKIVICGSANLNDRSQQGDRDSEVAVVIEDPAMRPSKMNGMPVYSLSIAPADSLKYQVSHFAASLRRRLMREHLGHLAAENFDTITPNSQPLPVENVYDWGSQEDLLFEDPLSPAFLELLTTTARNNAKVFWDIFRALPSDYGSF